MDHGGDLDRAIAQYGGTPDDWMDLSTGINPFSYPIPQLSDRAWTALPTRAEMNNLTECARKYYNTLSDIVALPGAQSAIQLLPDLRPKGSMKIIGPTYNEYENIFSKRNWYVDIVSDLDALKGADIAVVVNPNNPDGKIYSAHDLMKITDQVGILIVDESFMDMTPQNSLANHSNHSKLLILRSFGKFFGLAGVRLGFAIGAADLCDQLRARIGPWPISGQAIEVATHAFENSAWISDTKQKLQQLTEKMDKIIPWKLIGGTNLFRLYRVPDAYEMQSRLAQRHIWIRSFRWRNDCVRIGLTADLPSFQARACEVLSESSRCWLGQD